MNIRDKALENAKICKAHGWPLAAEGWEAMIRETGEKCPKCGSEHPNLDYNDGFCMHRFHNKPCTGQAPKQTDSTGGECPSCGAKEVEANCPQTVYECGSEDYDQRPGTFNQSPRCAAYSPIGAPKQDDEAMEVYRKWIRNEPRVSPPYFLYHDAFTLGLDHARKSDDEVIRRLEDLSVDDLPEQFREWHRGYFAIVELYATVCPGWATDGTVRHMVGNIKSRLNEERKSAESLREAVDILRYFYAFVPDSFHKERPLLITKVEAFLNEQEDK